MFVYLIWVAGIALQRVDVRLARHRGGGAVGNARVPLVWMDGWIDGDGDGVCVSVCVRNVRVLDLGGRVLCCSE